MEIIITSRETIKPSLPTSKENKTQKLCFFDVFQLNTYFPLILFYHKTNEMQGFSSVSTQLKKSLSEALTIFYPLGGRKSDHFSIDCNDEGVIYMEALVNINMEEFLNPPKIELLNQLLPCEPNKCHSHQEVLPQLLVQVNLFQCGGIAIGLCNLHILLDAYSCSVFLKTWCAICKGLKEEISRPDFISPSSFFPPRNIIGVRAGMLNIKNDSMEAKCTTRRFLFDSNAINELKTISTIDNIKPTRYQVVSSFLSKHMIVACTKESCDSTRPIVALHVVDMRKRMGEPFSKGSIGNLLWPAFFLLDDIKKNTNFKDLVRVLEKGLAKLTKELFLKIQYDPNFFWSDDCAKLMLEDIATKNPTTLIFTSWANMGFNEVNFGMGKPLWLAQRGGTKETVPNTVVLMETNEGLEAWVTMAEKHIIILENDVNFLQFASLNPTISNI